MSDVVLERGNGVHLAAELSRRAPELPILLMTGHTQEDLRPGELASAPVEVLHKPFGPAELEAAIARTLARAAG